jgi:hypothetical protein
MKNLKNNLTISSLDFMNSVVSSKKNTSKDLNRKTRFFNLVTKVTPSYSDYDIKLTNNSLPSLSNLALHDDEKEDLLELYNYDNSVLTKFRRCVTTDTGSNYQDTCQYCTINSVNTLDHFIPKDLFHEFSVHPHNLIPSCSQCNSKKSTRWIINNQHFFINLYTDLLPSQQYLFVEITVNSLNDIDVNFKVENQNNIPSQIYNILHRHYSELGLCQRFKDNCSDTIIELTNSIQASLNNGQAMQVIQQITLDKCNQNKLLKGFNHYKIILEEALIQCHDYTSSF